MVKQRISLKDVTVSIGGKIIGGAESASVKISRDNSVAYEGGNYMPVEIVGGKFSVEGELTRAFIDVTLLNELMPLNKAVPPKGLTLTAELSSGKEPRRNITIHDVVFDSVDINSLELDGYAKNTMPFKALSWEFK